MCVLYQRARRWHSRWVNRNCGEERGFSFAPTLVDQNFWSTSVGAKLKSRADYVLTWWIAITFIRIGVRRVVVRQAIALQAYKLDFEIILIHCWSMLQIRSFSPSSVLPVLRFRHGFHPQANMRAPSLAKFLPECEFITDGSIKVQLLTCGFPRSSCSRRMGCA